MLNSIEAAEENRKDTAEAQIRKKQHNIFKLLALVERLNGTVGGERPLVAELSSAPLIRAQSFITGFGPIGNTLSEH